VTVSDDRRAAMLRHPAGKQRQPRYVCVICTGPIGGCDCINQLLADRRIPYTVTS